MSDNKIEILKAHFKKTFAKLSFNDVLDNIPIVCYNLNINSQYLRHVLTRVPSASFLWTMKLYICDKMEHIVVFTYNYGKETHFIDYLGNFYESEKEFLAANVQHSYSIFGRKSKEIDLKKDKSYNFLESLKRGFTKLLGETSREVVLLRAFIDAFKNEELAEKKLREIKTIYSFFIKIKRVSNSFQCGPPFKVLVNGSPLDLEVEKYSQYSEYSLMNLDDEIFKYDHIIDIHLKKGILRGNPSDKSSHERRVNRQFSLYPELLPGCHELAGWILKELGKQLGVREFTYIVYWIKYKCLNLYDENYALEGLIANNTEVKEYAKEFDTLLTTSCRKNVKSSTHKFNCVYSSAYHANAHFDDLRKYLFVLHPTCKAITAEKIETCSLYPEDKITKIPLNDLEICLQYYLNAVPEHVFNASLYPCEEKNYRIEDSVDEDDTNYKVKKYFAGDILGIKSESNKTVISIYEKITI